MLIVRCSLSKSEGTASSGENQDPKKTQKQKQENTTKTTTAAVAETHIQGTQWKVCVIFSITFIFFKAVNFFTLVNCGGSVSFPTCLMLEWHTWRRFHVKPILNYGAEQPCIYNTPKKTTKYLKKTAYLAHCLQPPAQHDAWFDLVCVWMVTESRTTGRPTSKTMTRNLRNVFFFFYCPFNAEPAQDILWHGDVHFWRRTDPSS